MRIECRGCGRYGDFDYVAKRLPEPIKKKKPLTGKEIRDAQERDNNGPGR